MSNLNYYGYVLHEDGITYGAYNTREEAVKARNAAPNKDRLELCREEIFRKRYINRTVKEKALNFMLRAL